MSAPQPLRTSEEFAEWMSRPENEGKWLELVRGEVVERSWPTRLQGVVASRISSLLSDHAETSGRTYVTLGSCVQLRRDPDTLLRPDVAVFGDAGSFQELPPTFGVAAPLLAVVTLHLHVPYGRLMRLVEQYLAAGTRCVWLVDCEDRCVSVYPRGNSLHVIDAADEITGDDALPGFRCRVADFFRLPGEKPPS